jgi:hypothetical protein
LSAAAQPPPSLDQAIFPVVLEGAAEAGVIALRSTGDEPVVFLEIDQEVQVGGGRVEALAGMAATDRIIDARHGEAWVWWRRDQQVLRLRLLPTGDLTLEVQVDLEDWQPPPPLALPSPTVDEALAAWPAPEWLRAQARASAQGSVLQRATAMTLIARFASVPLESLLDGKSPWTEALAEWTDRPRSTREAIIDRAGVAADALMHELSALQQAVAARRADASLRARAWLIERDDLHGLLLLVEKAQEPADALDGLRTTLGQLDEAGRGSAAVFADACVRDERLAELSWREPQAWWAISC